MVNVIAGPTSLVAFVLHAVPAYLGREKALGWTVPIHPGGAGRVIEVMPVPPPIGLWTRSVHGTKVPDPGGADALAEQTVPVT